MSVPDPRLNRHRKLLPLPWGSWFRLGNGRERNDDTVSALQGEGRDGAWGDPQHQSGPKI